MGYSRVAVGNLLKELSVRGVGGVIIGSTVYQDLLKWRELEDDVDVFATTFSPSFNEDLLQQAAGEIDCFTGLNDWRMPQLKCSLGSEEVVVDFFENLYDFYIPKEIIYSARRIKLGEYMGRAIMFEDYLILKAKAGREKDLETLWFLADLVRSGKLKVGKELIKEHVKLFDYEDVKLINKRLRETGVIK